jgi:hypothetical protein
MAYAVTVVVVLLTGYGMLLARISPFSVSGLLILAGVGWFLWLFWRNTLTIINILREQERREGLAQQAQQEEPPPQQDEPPPQQDEPPPQQDEK